MRRRPTLSPPTRGIANPFDSPAMRRAWTRRSMPGRGQVPSSRSGVKRPRPVPAISPNEATRARWPASENEGVASPRPINDAPPDATKRTERPGRRPGRSRFGDPSAGSRWGDPRAGPTLSSRPPDSRRPPDCPIGPVAPDRASGAGRGLPSRVFSRTTSRAGGARSNARAWGGPRGRLGPSAFERSNMPPPPSRPCLGPVIGSGPPSGRLAPPRPVDRVGLTQRNTRPTRPELTPAPGFLPETGRNPGSRPEKPRLTRPPRER